ncbi:MAG TPA: CPBP family intramembrane glutamic endopeptidase [Bryobacteraceae bacterium]|nr:CPBP family intramembrane glutamic endopeptidase [Bryobacteraceae bacterium]
MKNALILILLAGIIGLLYAYSLSIPAAITAPVLAACVVELALYIAFIAEPSRRWIDRHLAPLPLWMAASALAPYLIVTLPLGAFDWQRFAALAGLAAVLSLWYTVLPRRRELDLLFIAIVAAGLLLPVFAWIYPRPHPKLPMAVLGQSMWTRLAMLAVVGVARIPVKGFGFIPTRAEWIAGTRNFLLFLPVGALIVWWTNFARFRPHPADWRLPFLAVVTFAGMLWIVALREEFFFRGLLQEWTTRWLKSEWLALILVSVLFGLAHLPFRDFPNWPMVALAAAAGVFYGRAYMEAKSVRAAMIAHALVNTVWRTMLG